VAAAADEAAACEHPERFRTRQRLCDNPAPRLGGRYCPGVNVERDKCGEQRHGLQCDEGERASGESIRQMDGLHFRQLFADWIEVLSAILTSA